MKLLKSFSTYTIISIVTAGIPFLLMPILTHYLTTNDYGKLSLFNTYVTILIPLTSIGTTSFITLQFFKQKKDRFIRLFSSILKVPFITTLIFLLLSFLFQNTLEELLELPYKLIILIPVIAFLTIIGELFFNLLIFQKKAKTFGAISILRTLIEVTLSLLFIISFKLNWEGRIYSWLIAAVLIFINSILYFKRKKWLEFKIHSPKLIKQALIFGAPLVPHLIGKFIINQSDTLFIAKMVSIEDAGIYRIGYQFGFIISIISNAFISIYSPYLYERLANITEQKKSEIIKLSYIFIASLIIITIVLTASSGFIFEHFIHSDFKSGTQFVFWTALSYVFWGGYLIFAGYIFYLKKTKILAYISIINISVNLLLNYFLIKEFGVIGVSYATTTSFFITFVLVAFISNRLYPMPWLNFRKG